MPRVPHTTRRNSVYYFNFRYSETLIRKGLTRSHAKFSLKTKDWRVATDRAPREAAFHQAEVERLMAGLIDSLVKVRMSPRDLGFKLFWKPSEGWNEEKWRDLPKSK